MAPVGHAQQIRPWAVHEPLRTEDYQELAAEVLRPCQWASAPARSALQAFALGLLVDAIVGALRARDMEDAGEDVWWLFYDDFPTRICGVAWACDVLVLDVAQLRRRMQEMLEAAHRWASLTEARCTAFAAWAASRREEDPKVRREQRPPQPRGTYSFGARRRLRLVVAGAR